MENPEHCDFARLRNLLLRCGVLALIVRESLRDHFLSHSRTHTLDLKDSTAQVLYEAYRKCVSAL